jgi:hypothetical protein
MQKISGILPSSNRLTTVDLKESGATRPGAPSFGRPQGESSLLNNSIVRSAHRALQQHNEQFDRKTKEQKNAEEIQKMADNFFKTQSQMKSEFNLVNDLLVDDQLVSASVAPTVSIPEFETEEEISSNDGPSENIKSLRAVSEVDYDAPEVGRYLDVHA